ncbi:beta-propeller domain-containing protein [Pontiella sulfatireligans]|uniref:SMP-30/Gluconolactonase/LRE-like region domain-containing protein n=1 Tax=Pontiella sulfatireligans TaxID=2750658 RepID=A0A6C2UK78_9BACT|nr:hypothetical protein [Pontiella sulfatireligans]VGO20508.1 hypothetical protein SCARR_02571 [Pontiella sulfatireligans]
MKRALAVVYLVAFTCSAEQQFLVTSHKPDGIHKVDSSGNVVWTYSDIRHPQDFDVDAQGNIFCSEILGAKMLSPEGKLLWRYDVPKGCQNPVAQFLGDGRFLVGNEGPGKLLEINSKGETLKEVQLLPKNDKSHGQFRFCRKTPQGTCLAPMTADGVVHEVSSEGEIIRDFGKFTQPVCAVRLGNGHTLIGSLRRLNDFDKDGKLVWSFNPVVDGKLPEGNKGHVCSIQPLENGDIAFTFYHGVKAWPDIMVVNRKKEVVKSIVLPEIDKVASLRKSL